MEIRKSYSMLASEHILPSETFVELVCKTFVGENRGKCDNLGLFTVIIKIAIT
jgi:hypothetical protein